MKKIGRTPPLEDMPEVYKSISLEPPSQPVKVLSIKDFSDLDLKRLPTLKHLLSALRQDEVLDDLARAMQHVLDVEQYGGSTEVLKKEIALYVMHEVEKFDLQSKSGAKKKELAVSLLKKLFLDDEVITSLVVDHLMPHLTQIGFVRRWLLRGYRYFLKKVSVKV
jgi:hypothetical protein